MDGLRRWPGRVPALAIGLVAVLAVGLTGAGAATAEDRAQPDPATRVTYLVGLPHDRAALDSAATRVSSPDSPRFRRYLTLAQVADRFGASERAEDRLTRAARRLSLDAEIDPSRLFARVTGTVAAWERVMGTAIHYRPATVGSAQWSNSPPFAHYRFPDAAVPAGLAPVVTWWMPSYVEYVPALDIPGPPPPEPTTPASTSPTSTSSTPRTLVYPGDGTDPAPTNGGSPLGTTCLSPERNLATFTPFQVSTAYGMRGLQDLVVAGLRPRVTVLSLGGGFTESDIVDAAKCFGHASPRIDIRTGMGLPEPIVSLSDETALDLQTVSWALKGVREVRFVQVVPGATAWIEAYSLALSQWQTPPHAITLSWGGCELLFDHDSGPDVATESLFRMAALLGVSLFTAAGDTGSSVCQVEGVVEASLPIPTVGYPASSPFMTAVGGTQLNLGPGNVRVGESVWNGLQFGDTGNAVGTGGPSAVFDAPWYQRPRTWSDVRSVPDIAALAGNSPGMPLVFGGQLYNVGGTSQASPLVASGFAMLSAELEDAGRPPLGFVNPWIYRTIRERPGTFYDVTVGDNQYPLVYAPDSVNIPACCQAQPGFDMASGLGAPLFDRLSRALG